MTAVTKIDKVQPLGIIKPYAWPDPASIPPRQFLYGGHYARGSVSASVGAGGRIKTTLALTDAIGMTAGRNLTTGCLQEPLRVCYLNGEEDQDELDRRIAAICQHYGIKPEDCGDRLHVQSVRDKPLRLATMNGNGAALNSALLEQLERAVRDRRIDTLTLDPLISFHGIRENANEDMDLLLKEGLGGIASRTKAAIEIVHHPGKPKPG
jgi:RecA-family ATPase